MAVKEHYNYVKDVVPPNPRYFERFDMRRVTFGRAKDAPTKWQKAVAFDLVSHGIEGSIPDAIALLQSLEAKAGSDVRINANYDYEGNCEITVNGWSDEVTPQMIAAAEAKMAEDEAQEAAESEAELARERKSAEAELARINKQFPDLVKALSS